MKQEIKNSKKLFEEIFKDKHLTHRFLDSHQFEFGYDPTQTKEWCNKIDDMSHEERIKIIKDNYKI